tara:strand:- start:665 stop:1006 length:342 start_codon:yes stop_codon:yes gene_type:complete
MNKMNWLMVLFAICFIYLVGNYFAIGFDDIIKEGMTSDGQKECGDLTTCTDCQDPLENTAEGRCVWEDNTCKGDRDGKKPQTNCLPPSNTPSQESQIVTHPSDHNYYFGTQQN